MMTPEARAALKSHLAHWQIGHVIVGDAKGIASVDRSRNPATLVVLAVRPDGEVIAGRRRVADAGQNPLQVCVDRSEWTTSDLTNAMSTALDWFGMRQPGRCDLADAFLVSFRSAHPRVDIADEDVLAIARASLVAAKPGEISRELNQEAIAALSCASQFPNSAYAFYAAPGEKGQIRRQAAASYPLLAADFASKVMVKLAIDMRMPLADAIERSYGADKDGTPFLGKALQRRLANKAWPDGGVPIPVIVESLSKVPADWFPKTPEDWFAFLDVADTAFRHLAREIGEKPESLAAGCAGRWTEFQKRVAKSFAPTLPPDDLPEEEKANWKPFVDESRGALEGACVGAKDVVRAFRDLVVLPAAAMASNGGDVFLGAETLQIANDAAARILYAGKSLSSIMELQRHWHTQAANIFNAVAGRELTLQRGKLKEVAADGWAPLCDMYIAPNGVAIVPLTDPQELEDEGARGHGNPGPDRNGIRGLGHCVGTYVEACRRQGHHIISYRLYDGDGQFTRLSTAEFGPLTPDTTALNCRQHRGKNNGTPPALAQEAHEWFMTEVAEKRLPVNHDGVMKYLAGQRVVRDDVQRYCGYDRKDAELVATAFEPWRPYLPKRLRNATLEEFRAIPEMAELTETLVPTFSAALRR